MSKANPYLCMVSPPKIVLNDCPASAGQRSGSITIRDLVSDVDIYVAAMVLTNPSGTMVKPQRAVAAPRLRMFVTGGPLPSRALCPHKAVRREREGKWHYALNRCNIRLTDKRIIELCPGASRRGGCPC